MPETADLRDKFRNDLAEVNWQDLRLHLQRDAIILVAENLDLLDVAAAVALDNKAQVAPWIAAGELTKPVRAQLDQWENQLDKLFRMLIVQPYILAQPVCHA